MATTTEQLRQALEDMVYANIINIFLVKHDSLSAAAGENTISLTGDAYDDADDYEIRIIEALDVDGIDVKGELTISEKAVGGFKITAVRACDIEWQTARKSPKINFHT